MPPTVMLSYNIPGAGRGGKLVAAGPQPKPVLQPNDALQVQVRWAGNPNGRPDSLQGVVVITPMNGSSQSTASPFVDAATGRVACLMVNTVQGDNGVYTFPAMVYMGGRPGQFELTFVAADTTTDTMWSVDPEFDTGS